MQWKLQTGRCRCAASHPRRFLAIWATSLAMILGFLPSCDDPNDLYAAIKRGSVRSVKRLTSNKQVLDELQPVQIGVLNISYRMTPLQAAAYWGQDDVAQALITAGASVNGTDSLGVTPLHMACGAEQQDMIGRSGTPDFGVMPKLSMVRLLLDAGASVNARAHRGITPLMNAASVARIEVIRALLDAGADVSAVVEVGNTVLDEALNNPDSSIITLLVRHGAALEARDGIGATALMRAAYLGKEEAVNALLAAGADPFATDDAGYSALDFAQERPYPLKTGTVESRKGIIAKIEAARRQRGESK